MMKTEVFGLLANNTAVGRINAALRMLQELGLAKIATAPHGAHRTERWIAVEG